MTTGVKWVRMTPEEYQEYKRGREASSKAWKDGYEKGWSDSQYFFRSYTPEDLELENDEN